MPRRQLSPTETAEARLVFGAGLKYGRISIVENTEFPNIVAAIGRAPKPNAVSLGGTIYFPETLLTSAQDIAQGNLRAMAWLMHELAHQWQYQRMGWVYLARSGWVQVTQGRTGYVYEIVPGRKLADYNLEQQGDIARDYYCALKTGWNCTHTAQREPAAWEALVEEFRRL